MSESEPSLPQTQSNDSPADTHAEMPEHETRRPPVLPTVFALLALGVSIGLVVGGYFIWTELQKMTGEQARLEPRLEQRVQPLQSNLQAMNKDWQAGRREIEQKLDTLGDGQTVVGERVNRLASLIGRGELGWTLAEVEYLLRVANESLQLRRDRRTTVTALKSADARLRELADPQLLPVREQLARELNKLREIPEVDFDGISVRLDDGLRQIDRFPVAGSQYEPPALDIKRFDATDTAGNWRDLPQVIWASVKELFRFREHDKPVGPMLPSERAWFLKENLRLQLAAARLALLREDSDAYRHSLVTAATWLREWFDAGDDAVTAMAARLEEMAAVDIRPDFPDISASLRLLQEMRKRQEMLAVPASDAGNDNTQADAVSPSVEEKSDTTRDGQ